MQREGAVAPSVTGEISERLCLHILCGGLRGA